MKSKHIGILALAMVTSSGGIFAQGTFLFSNLTDGVDAPVSWNNPLDNVPPIPLTGPDWTASVILGQGTTVLGTQLFSDDPEFAGYFFGPVIEVPDTNPGDMIILQIIAFDTEGGPQRIGGSRPFALQLGGGNLPPGTFVNMEPFEVSFVPEPSTWTLMILGGLALFFFTSRRSKHY